MLPKVSVGFVQWVVAVGLIVMIITDLYKGKYQEAVTRFAILGFMAYLSITVKVEIK